MNKQSTRFFLRYFCAVSASWLFLNGCDGVEEDLSASAEVEANYSEAQDFAVGDEEENERQPPFCSVVCRPIGTCDSACYDNGWITCSDYPAPCEAPPPDDFCDLFDNKIVTINTSHGTKLWTQEPYTGVSQGIGAGGTADGYEFIIRCQDGGKVAFETIDGVYLRAWNKDNWRVNIQNFIGSWEKWTPSDQDGGRWSFKSAHGRFLQAEKNWPKRVRQSSHLNDKSKFTINPI